MSNEDNAIIVWKHLKDLGLSDAKAAAVMGNLSQESGFQTDATSSDGNDSFGIAQWTFGRKDALRELADSLGSSMGDINVQLQHFDNEISEGGSRHQAWLNLVNSDSSDVDSLTTQWCSDFEGPDPQYANYSNRIGEAYRYQQALGGGQTPINPFSDRLSGGEWRSPARQTEEIPQVVHPDTQFQSSWDAFKTGVTEGFMGNTIMDAGRLIVGNLFHTGNHLGGFKPLSQEDAKFVSDYFPDDISTQKWILSNARDSEEVRWLTEQKSAQRKRLEEIQNYNDGHLMTAANAGLLAGGLLDPLNLIPIGSSANIARTLARTGNTIRNIEKVSRFAQAGAEVAAFNTADNMARESLWNEKKTPTEYGYSAALGFVAGSVMSALGHGLSSYSGRVRSIADQTETRAIHLAQDVDADNVIKTETLSQALKMHDTEYGKGIKSSLYDTLESSQKLVSLSREDATKLAQSFGKVLPDDARALYVPNEGYSILIKDAMKDTADVEQTLMHEFGVHAGLKGVLGEERFGKLMSYVADESKNDASVWGKARKAAGTEDPEEILATAIENDMLSKRNFKVLGKNIQESLGINGYGSTKFSNASIMDMVRQSIQQQRENAMGIHYNPDGSTAFAGVKFSRDNMMNPDTLAHLFTLEAPLMKTAQGDLGTSVLGRFIRTPLQRLGRFAEAGKVTRTPYGSAINSPSVLLRETASKLFNDVRGRGHSEAVAVTAETHKDMIRGQLLMPYTDYINAREAWCLEHMKFGRGACMEFDKQAIMEYNAEFAKNVSGYVKNKDPHIQEAIRHIKAFREKEIEIGKNSSGMVGSLKKNLIEEDWKPVDEELWRLSTPDLVNGFIHSFVSDGNENALEKAEKWLISYYRAAAIPKKEVTREKIARGIEKENKEIKAWNDSHKTAPQKPLKDTNVTDEMLQEYWDEHIPPAVSAMLGTDMHSMEGRLDGEVGELSFLKHRVPIDTSLIMKMPNDEEFSFDNTLRNFDLDFMVGRNINRFAGEAALNAIFASKDSLGTTLKQIRYQLGKAASAGEINQGRAEQEIADLNEAINELRGFRPKRDTIQTGGSIARILQGMSYFKNGANMAFAQLGELGGTMAYGGLHQIFNVFKPLGNLVDDARLGKVTAANIRDGAYHIWGENLERQIWSTNWGDRVMRDALTKRSITNSILQAGGDMATTARKVTSTLNMLPKLTDAMVRGMREQALLDSIRWANGETFSKIRNPFSPAKLRASNINPTMADRIKSNINKYTTKDGEDITGLDYNKWQQEDPYSFARFYDMMNTQAERGSVSGTRLGNRNILKDSSSLSKIMFQFKDYTFRAPNAQTFRAMTAGDLDDAIATAMSMVTNTAAYALRGAAMVGFASATGADEKAKQYYETYFNPETLIRVAALRSTILGSPLSPLNDLYEAFSGAPSIRTTVQRTTRPIKNRDASDVVGDFMTQLPAVKTGLDYTAGAYNAFSHLATNTASKSDFRNMLNLLPVPNLIPFTQLVNGLVDGSGYPDKRPAK